MTRTYLNNAGESRRSADTRIETPPAIPIRHLTNRIIVDPLIYFFYYLSLRVSAVLILLVILFGIIIPPTFPGAYDQARPPEIGTLDVCRSAMPALSLLGHIPCIHERPNRDLPLSPIATISPDSRPFTPTLLASQPEHPPQA